MIYLVGFPLLVVSIVLLVMGGASSKAWALYALKMIWVLLTAVAAYVVGEAWKGSAYSENWEMIGVIFIAWPAAGFVVLSAGVEMLLLKGRRDLHAKINRLLSAIIVLVLVVLAISPLVVGEIVK